MLPMGGPFGIGYDNFIARFEEAMTQDVERVDAAGRDEDLVGRPNRNLFVWAKLLRDEVEQSGTPVVCT